jgi:hypothetical protein
MSIFKERATPMRINRTMVCAVIAFSIGSLSAAQAQQTRRAAAAAPPPPKCLKALDGSCTNPDMVEAARLRAAVFSSVRVSYFGTPAGTVGGGFIPFERLFQDNDLLFGLPTSTCTVCVTVRTK